MSYCRWDRDCHVYMYASVYGGYEFHLSNKFCSSHHGIKDDWHADTRQEALEIFDKLKKLGASFPEYATKRLEEEIAQGEPEHEPDPDGF